MSKEYDLFSMADSLEESAAHLKRVKDLLAISLDGLFVDDNWLLPYHKQFSSVLECAFDVVEGQIETLDKTAACLYEINKNVKTVT